MVYVVVFAVSVVVASLLWLGLLAVRAFRQVKALGRTVADASARIGEAGMEIERIVPKERYENRPAGAHEG